MKDGKKVRLDKLWHDPVWSKVIAAIIIAIAGSILTYFFNWWSAIGKLIGLIYQLAISRIELPIWLLLFVFVLALLFVVSRAIDLFNKTRKRQISTSTWKDYRADEFYNLKWRWKYADDNALILPNEIQPFCLSCDYQVRPIKSNTFDVVNRISFFCDSCNKHVQEFDETYNSLIDKIIRLVQQKIRKKDWNRPREQT